MYIKNPSLFSMIFMVAIVLLIIYIFYKSFIQSAGAILLKQENPSTSFYTVDVVAEDLQVPFFGSAFHVNYNPQNYIYDHFTLGDYFSSDDDPLVLVNQKDSKIIVGISLKRGQLLTKSEGTLLKLYFKKNPQSKNPSFTDPEPTNNFSFSNAIFSTFDTKKGERKDIKNITFTP